MTMRKARKLRQGAYRVLWKSGGTSVAAVGRTYDGTPWLAAANWTAANNDAPLIASTKCWREVAEVMLIGTGS